MSLSKRDQLKTESVPGINLLKLDKLGSHKDPDTEPGYVQDFGLAPAHRSLLFNEYLEIVIQFGFITIFVAAFPLAPLFALINNILEIRLSQVKIIWEHTLYFSRLDAKKLLVRYRRPIPQNARDIGIWLDIMSTLTRVAVITNAFIIAITSDFIPELVYSTMYSESGDLRGYVNFTLSYLDTRQGELEGGRHSAGCVENLFSPAHQANK